MSNFRQTKVKTIMEEVLREKLTGATYHPDNTSQWTREIADEIKQSLKLQVRRSFFPRSVASCRENRRGFLHRRANPPPSAQPPSPLPSFSRESGKLSKDER